MSVFGSNDVVRGCALVFLAIVPLACKSPSGQTGELRGVGNIGSGLKAVRSTVMSNVSMGSWVGTWNLRQAMPIIADLPHPREPLPQSLELRVHPYRMAFDDVPSIGGENVHAEFLEMDSDGASKLWGGEGWPVKIGLFEIEIGPFGSPRRFTYVLRTTNNHLELEMINAGLNARLVMQKVSDEPPRLVNRQLILGNAASDTILADSEAEYRKWRQKANLHRP